MRILNTKQMRELDGYTIKHEPIASIDLMERASRAFVEWFTLHVEATRKVGVICGTGNNGGDGLAIARMLIDYGYPTKVWIVLGGVAESEEFKINRSQLPDKIEVRELRAEN